MEREEKRSSKRQQTGGIRRMSVTEQEDFERFLRIYGRLITAAELVERWQENYVLRKGHPKVSLAVMHKQRKRVVGSLNHNQAAALRKKNGSYRTGAAKIGEKTRIRAQDKNAAEKREALKAARLELKNPSAKKKICPDCGETLPLMERFWEKVGDKLRTECCKWCRRVRKQKNRAARAIGCATESVRNRLERYAAFDQAKLKEEKKVWASAAAYIKQHPNVATVRCGICGHKMPKTADYLSTTRGADGKVAFKNRCLVCYNRNARMRHRADRDARAAFLYHEKLQNEAEQLGRCKAEVWAAKREKALLEAREAAADATDENKLMTCQSCRETFLKERRYFRVKKSQGRTYYSLDCRWCYNDQRRKGRKKK